MTTLSYQGRDGVGAWRTAAAIPAISSSASSSIWTHLVNKLKVVVRGRHERYLDVEHNPHIPPPIVSQELEEVAQRWHGLGPKVSDGAEGLEVGPFAVTYELVDAEAALKAGVLGSG